jgi:hypothetical protein
MGRRHSWARSSRTVSNYFARKADLLFDRADEVMLLLREALGGRPKRQSPIDALRRLVDTLCEQKHPFARIDRQTVGKLAARFGALGSWVGSVHFK